MSRASGGWLTSPCPVLRLPGETWATVWGRRLLSWTTLTLLFVVGWLAAPVWLGGFRAWDHLKGAGAIAPRTRCGFLLLLYLSCQVWGMLAAGALWAITLGGAIGGHERYRRANSALQTLWAGTLFRGVCGILNLRLEAEGFDRPLPSPFLLLVRHTSLLDTLLASVLLAGPHRRRLRFVLKKELLWDPCLDLVGRRLRNVFVERGGENPRRELEAIRGLAEGLEPDEGVLIYPEGTRFTPAKLARAKERWAENGGALGQLAEEFRWVLPPRLGGSMALLESGHDVLVLTHSGLEKAADLSGAWSGRMYGSTIHARLTCHPAAEIPAEQRDLWLFRVWADLDEWIEQRA